MSCGKQDLIDDPFISVKIMFYNELAFDESSFCMVCRFNFIIGNQLIILSKKWKYLASHITFYHILGFILVLSYYHVLQLNF